MIWVEDVISLLNEPQLASFFLMSAEPHTDDGETWQISPETSNSNKTMTICFLSVCLCLRFLWDDLAALGRKRRRRRGWVYFLDVFFRFDSQTVSDGQISAAKRQTGALRSRLGSWMPPQGAAVCEQSGRSLQPPLGWSLQCVSVCVEWLMLDWWPHFSLV